MIKICTSVAACFFVAFVYGQQTITSHRSNRFIDLTGTVGASQGAVAGSYVYNWRIGTNRKFEIGLGARATSYFGTKKDFTTAPGRLARSTTIPFLIVVAGHEEHNLDTLTVQRPFTTSLNLSANFGYNLGQRWYGGFNIDLIGVTLRRKGSGILTTTGETINEPNARPTTFNVLLTGDNDFGSLNSEFFIKYKLSPRWALKAVYQFVFVEYKTETVLQKAPDGSQVDRFRNKANTLGLGVSYHFLKQH
jgi:hypothetical protein